MGNELVSKFANDQAQNLDRLRQEMLTYRMERCRWKLDLIIAEWNAGNRDIFRDDFSEVDIRNAKEFVLQENVKDQKGEYDETVTAGPDSAIKQDSSQKRPLKRRRIAPIDNNISYLLDAEGNEIENLESENSKRLAETPEETIRYDALVEKYRGIIGFFDFRCLIKLLSDPAHL